MKARQAGSRVEWSAQWVVGVEIVAGVLLQQGCCCCYAPTKKTPNVAGKEQRVSESCRRRKKETEKKNTSNIKLWRLDVTRLGAQSKKHPSPQKKNLQLKTGFHATVCV